jgi:tRNA uridine 5-carbamoylmethylation protein Kti12
MKLIVLCGIPGSGKTTLSKKLSSEYNAVRLSFDEMRCFQHRELIPHIRESLLAGNNVVVDSLYVERRHRTELLKSVADIQCGKYLITLDTPLDECLCRNANRESRLPDFVVKSIHAVYDAPSLDEGWDEIIAI